MTKSNTKKDEQTAIMKKTRHNKSRIHSWSAVTMISVLLISGAVLFSAPLFKNKANATEITVYKSSTCNCCDKWVDHLRDAGFDVKAINHDNMFSVKLFAGVQAELQSCHTAFVDDYVVEGHVPAEDIKRLLQERPEISGISVPGMPMGSPGMEGGRKDNYEVLTFDEDGETSVYARH